MTFFVTTRPGTDLAALARGATLLLPAVSTGNVPQLAVDLLLASLPHEIVGCFHSQHVQPCVGGDALAVALPANSSSSRKQKKDAAAAAPAPAPLTTVLQLWHIPSLQLLVVQQRAPALRGRNRALVSELLAWAQPLPLRQMLLLTSSVGFRRADQELDAMHPVSFFFVDPAAAGPGAPPARGADTLALLRETLQWTPLADSSGLAQDERPFKRDQLNSAVEDDSLSSGISGGSGSLALDSAVEDEQREPARAQLKRIPVPGLGITRPFFEALDASSSNSASTSSSSSSSSSSPASFTAAALPPTVFLSVSVNEGANDRDGMLLAHSVYTLLFLQQTSQAPREQAASVKSVAAAAGEAVPSSLQLRQPTEMVWTAPSSWSAMFGTEADHESMYL